METRLSLRHAHMSGQVCQVQAERGDLVSDNTVRMMLTLLAPPRRSGSKWRFSDGSANFSAIVADEAFLAQVNAGGRLVRGDVLEVEMRIRQVRAADRIGVERTILRVLETLLHGQHLLLL